MRIPGYEIDRRLVVGVKRTYYKGRRLSDNKPVIIKTATAIPPTQQDLTQAVHESDILKSIDIKGVTTPIAVEDFGKGSVLIYADKDYYSLKESIQTRKIALQDVLLISLNLTDIIGDLHLAGVIHKDIQPENIFIESPSNRVWISDFGIASFLPKENPMILNPDILGCSPIYISPEQSGRMNRSLDYRTDFYSLGITIYEMLTGRPPFQNIDPLELVHSHLAKQPLPPHQIDSDIPEVVSRIVLKLLAKTAEDRYQSVFGLKEDLETCRNRFLLDGSVPDFQIGVKDVSDIFRISQKLYGREKEINTLLELFERNNCGRVEMVMVSGYSGIGKTSLVREILKPITRKKGYFISGKSDQYHKNIPYSLLTSVFENLIRQLLTESEDQLKKWKARILDVLGDNGQLIIDVIPTIQLVIGPQLPVKSLNSEDAQIRFHAVLIDFIRVFRESEHPLIAFLDDLQWIDSATLNVLELVLADEELKHLFLIGAYRDNEVDDTHPLMISMKKFKSEGNNIHHIHLAPLEVDSIKVLIADTLKNESESIAPLAELVHRKTNGNPFFVNRFLTALYQQKLLVFNWSSSQWQWDISHIQSQDITDNVIDLLIKRLKDISAETVDLLRFAACIGNQFELKMLSLLCGKEPAETLSILIPAIKEDLVESVSGFRMISEIAIDDSMQVEALKFQHDRIYKACYDLTDEFEKKSIHLQIGKVLLENLDGKKKEEAVFDILNHLNQSFELIETDIEREELARLNLLAGRKAKSSAAFESAMEYIETAYHLLRPNYWEEQYQLALEVHTEYLDITHNCGRFEEMELWFGLIKQNALTPLDKVSAYNSCIVACMAQNRIKDANQTSLEILSALGESVDEKLTEDEVLQKVEKIMRGLGSQDIEGLADLSEMTDPSKLAALTILSSMN
ncbi:serine/threonine-protein kinase PknK, partial [bacterium]|nr:serine/threonine-protein kinase PknK [bacterium]